MRVLVLNASPKGEQSHTMAITRAFLSGFPEGTQTELLELRHLNIRPCTGCLGCWTKTPGRCVQRDDMDRVYAAIAAADVVVESFPLYFYGIPGTLKTLTDRCLPYTKAYGWRGPSSRMPRSSASRARTGASSTNKQRRRNISAEYFFQNGCGTIPHPFSLTKSPFGPFRQAAFQNCKIEFCSIILQFCRCGG